jgi:hypothetical protein
MTTHIRLTGGRDRGHVKEFPFAVAREMIKNGQALPVDFAEKDPLAYRELTELSAEVAKSGELLLDPTPPPAAPEVTIVTPTAARRIKRFGR